MIISEADCFILTHFLELETNQPLKGDISSVIHMAVCTLSRSMKQFDPNFSAKSIEHRTARTYISSASVSGNSTPLNSSPACL